MARSVRFLLPLVFAVLLPVAPALAQPADPGPVSEVDVQAFGNWLNAWSKGQILLVKQGRLDRRADRTFRNLFGKIALGQDLTAAKRLWQAAVFELPKDVDKHARLAASPGRVTGHAKKLIASIADASVDQWLIEIASRKGGKAGNRYRLTAIEVLGMRERPEVGKLLLAKLPRLPIPERIQAVLALERTGSVDALPVLLKLLKNREPNLRIALVQAITGILAPYSDETRANNLASDAEGVKWKKPVTDGLRAVMMKDKVWQVRVAICDGLVRLRTRLAIPILIGGLKRELGLGKWSNRMVAISFHDALEQLTGTSLPENSPKLWDDFWKKEGARFRFATRDQRKKPATPSSVEYAKYFNLDIKTKRLLFIIDFSGSMAEKVSLQSQGRYAGSGSRQVKYQLVKKELEKVVRGLPRDSICNVVFFNDRVSIWRRDASGRPKLVKMTDDNKSDLLQYIWETSPSGSTNLFGALKAALSMGDRGVYDKYYNAAYDSVFLLSDGAPSSGETTDTKEIREHVRKTNKLRRIKIHTIVFGEERNNAKFLKKLAEENSGQFMHVK